MKIMRGTGIDVMSKAPFNNPFAHLQSQRDQFPEGKQEVTKPLPEKKGPSKAVVRMERKGRGGKEVTVIEQLELSADELKAWLKALKAALGCGGTVEDSALVLQGDHRERVEAYLRKRGVSRVSVG